MTLWLANYKNKTLCFVESKIENTQCQGHLSSLYPKNASLILSWTFQLQQHINILLEQMDVQKLSLHTSW
jgi:hypothetical protein